MPLSRRTASQVLQRQTGGSLVVALVNVLVRFEFVMVVAFRSSADVGLTYCVTVVVRIGFVKCLMVLEKYRSACSRNKNLSLCESYKNFTRNYR